MKTAAQFKSWWNKYEAAYQISKRTRISFILADLLRIALDRGVQFVVDVPTGTQDSQGRPMESGLWDLITGGKDGEPGRRQVEYEMNAFARLSNVNLDGITGAWVSREGDRRQLRPEGYPYSCISPIPNRCTVGLRRQVAEDLAETLSKLAEEEASSNTPIRAIRAEWKDLAITFLSDHRVQMKIGGRSGLKNLHKLVKVCRFSADGYGIVCVNSHTDWRGDRLTPEQFAMGTKFLLPLRYIFHFGCYYYFGHWLSPVI